MVANREGIEGCRDSSRQRVCFVGGPQGPFYDCLGRRLKWQDNSTGTALDGNLVDINVSKADQWSR